MECGGCTLCCKLLDIPGIAPQGVQCEHASSCGEGCTIYNERPEVCKSFDCLWLHSQVMGHDLRPDRCGVVFDLYKEERTVIAMAEKTLANSKMQLLVQQMLIDGYIVWILIGKDRTLLLPEGISEEVALERAKVAWRKRVWRRLRTQRI